jgi:hypothetical protein
MVRMTLGTCQMIITEVLDHRKIFGRGVAISLRRLFGLQKARMAGRPLSHTIPRPTIFER